MSETSPPASPNQPSATQGVTYAADAVIESGPDHSPALRIQLDWTTGGKTV
jgi:hypothetical protein